MEIRPNPQLLFILFVYNFFILSLNKSSNFQESIESKIVDENITLSKIYKNITSKSYWKNKKKEKYLN